MKPNPTTLRLGALLCALSAPLAAQSVPAPAATPSSSSSASEELLVLTPFEVNSTKDVGYLARNTLAGSRLNTSLRDVAAQISIMTPEFLSDVAAVTLDEALRYSLNIENTKEFYDVVTNNNATFTNAPTGGNNRVRGLGQSSPTHDFFRTVLPIDAYNSERFTFVYGPNAILFGSGQPAGSTDTTLKRARPAKRSYDVETRLDSNDTWRASVDLNQPLLPQKLALRVAGVKMDNREARKPNYDRQERVFATITATPFKWVTARAWYENVNRDRMPVRNTVVTDAITPWIAAGRPIFDNGVGRTLPANTNTATAANYSAVFLPYTDATRPLANLGVTGGATPAGTMYANTTVVTRSYDSIAPAPDNFDYSLADGTVYPFSVNFSGQTLLNRSRGDIRGLSAEFNPLRNFFIEVGGNQERFVHKYVDLIPYGSTELRVDANRFLPDRVTPNPNVGRYYFTSGPDTGVAYYSVRSQRISGSYEFNFAETLGRDKWTKWLGRHRVAGLWTYEEFREGRQRGDIRVISDHSFTTETAATQNNNANRDLRMRFYVDNPQAANTGQFAASLPFDPFAPGILPGTDWRVATLDNPFGVRDPQTNTRQYASGRVFTLQSFLLQDRLVVTYGKRHDTSKSYSIAAANQIRTGTGANAGYAWWYDQWDGAKQRPGAIGLDQTRQGDTRLVNVVVHPFRWMSLFYDESNTQDPPASIKLNLDGSATQVGNGLGKNWGATFSLLKDNLVLRLNKFQTSQQQGISQYRAFTGIGGINPFRDAIHNIERSAMVAGAPASQKFAHYSNAMRSLGAGTAGNAFRETYDVVSDKVSEGYEVELIANPLKNWRVSGSWARTDPVESGIATTWFDFIADRLPVWAQYQASPTYTGQAIGGALTVRDLVVGNAINSWNFIKTVEGRRVEQQRRDRLNFTTRYSFTEGFARGLFIGGSAVWRAKATLGYGVKTARGSELAYTQGFVGANDTLVINDATKPITGPALEQLDGFLGYSRRLWQGKVGWRVQLNVRNLFDDRDRLAQRVTSTGAVAVFTIPEKRTFILTNSFSF